MKKTFFIIFGMANFILFHVVIVMLFFFLYQDNTFTRLNLSLPFAIAWDLLLLTLFTVPHSYLLTPAGRKFTQFLPPKLHMTFYAFHASATLFIMCLFWAPFGEFYQAEGVLKISIYVLNTSCWLLIMWAIFTAGPMKQIGMEQWWNFIKNRPIHYNIPYNGPYRFMRHPIYVAFFGMIWFTPHLSISHLILSVYWSIYLVWGAMNKDKRLLKKKEYYAYYKTTAATPMGYFWRASMISHFRLDKNSRFPSEK